MKKVIKYFAALLSAILVFTVGVQAAPRVNAAGSTYHDLNSGYVGIGNVVVAVDGTFDTTSVEDILARINQYRYEACTAGNVPDPRQPSRMLTAADYVPIRWSNGLEHMAMLRAAEGSIVKDHTRPNGSSAFSAYYSVYSWHEVLAWYGSLLSGMNGWYQEKNAWVNQTGAVTGHYTAMINPGNTYCGIACFNGSAAGEFTSSTGALDETKIDVSQYCGQYMEIKGSSVYNYSFSSDSSVPHNGGQTNISLTVDINATDYWGRTYQVNNLRVIAADWRSSNTSAATVDTRGTVTGISVGQTTISVQIGSNTISKAINVVDKIEMYRMYNPNSGEHFYTGSSSERDNLVAAGWNYEGIAWYAPLEGSPVYRMYNPYAGDHHYTMSADERDYLVSVGWVYEGVGWNSAEPTGLPLLRLYNPRVTGAGAHHYTASVQESNDLQAIGWQYEGIGWYGA